MKDYINGYSVEVSPEEEARRIAEYHRAELEQTYIVDTETALRALLEMVKVTMPSGARESLASITGKPLDLPRKIGYRWELMESNAGGYAFALVADPTALGTRENPIYYYEGCPEIDNAWYMRDGHLYVYMDGWEMMD